MTIKANQPGLLAAAQHALSGPATDFVDYTEQTRGHGRTEEALLDLLRQLVEDQNLTVVAVLHDLKLAAAYSDTLVVLDHGRVAAASRSQDVLTDALLQKVSASAPIAASIPRPATFTSPCICEQRHRLCRTRDQGGASWRTLVRPCDAGRIGV